MEVTILDAADNRYDPEFVDVNREPGRDILVVRHDEPVSFSRGDAVRIILASDTYKESRPSDMVKRRREVKTVTGRYLRTFSETVSCWEIAQTAAVSDVLDAETHFRITDFD